MKVGAERGFLTSDDDSAVDLAQSPEMKHLLMHFEKRLCLIVFKATGDYGVLTLGPSNYEVLVMCCSGR